MSERMGWRVRRWQKEIDGQVRTCVAEVDPQGVIQVTEELVAEWMAEMGWTEAATSPP